MCQQSRQARVMRHESKHEETLMGVGEWFAGQAEPCKQDDGGGDEQNGGAKRDKEGEDGKQRASNVGEGGHAGTRGDEDEWMGYEAKHGAGDETRTGGRHEAVFGGGDGRGTEDDGTADEAGSI